MNNTERLKTCLQRVICDPAFPLAELDAWFTPDYCQEVNGERLADGTIELTRAAYTGCGVVDRDGCPREPSWRITADRVVYSPADKRVRYDGARLELFGLPVIRQLPQRVPAVGRYFALDYEPDAIDDLLHDRLSASRSASLRCSSLARTWAT